jgi:hypothetical protein
MAGWRRNWSICAAVGLSAFGLSFAAPQPKANECSDTSKNCLRPVKYLTNRNGCYIYACEYGTAKSRLIKVGNQKEKEALDKIAASR